MTHATFTPSRGRFLSAKNNKIQTLTGHESPQHRRYLRELAAEQESNVQAPRDQD
ncbi:hypothetical protein SynNOUM97013_01221 [Synechococcus sp. NOUM97013]|nr:hypothetical protein SynNOUM97013_01221 [Synechococcus sp. NOUM97013]